MVYMRREKKRRALNSVSIGLIALLLYAGFSSFFVRLHHFVLTMHE